MGPHAVVVRVLGLTGMRWGVMAGLQVRDLDVARRRIHIRRHVTEVGGRLEVVPATKNHEDRLVTGPSELFAELARLAEGRSPDDVLLPGTQGGIRRHGRFHHQWAKRVQGPATVPPRPAGRPGPAPAGGLGLDIRIHDLRHTAASLLIAAGADVKAVQRQLGHKSATLTRDLYGHLFEDSLDRLSEAMDRL